MGKALFITGTGTDIGKTYVTGLIVKRLKEAGVRTGYYKAALSGAETSADGSLLPGGRGRGDRFLYLSGCRIAASCRENRKSSDRLRQGRA